jgi:hypothetical protein
MHANLAYQSKVSMKFQPNRTAHGWEIPIFVRDRLQQQQTTDMNCWRHIKLESIESVATRSQQTKRGPTQSQAGQDDRTMSNWCIKERNEKRKTRKNKLLRGTQTLTPALDMWRSDMWRSDMWRLDMRRWDMQSSDVWRSDMLNWGDSRFEFLAVPRT